MLYTSRLTRYAQILPLILLLLGLTIFPTFFAYYISTQHVELTRLNEASYVGLQNFGSVLTDINFYDALWFSVRYALITTVVESLIGLGLALWFNRKKLPGRGILLSLMLLPVMVSPALLGIMFRLMLNEFVGPMAHYLKSIGLPGAQLLTPQYIMTTLVSIDVFQWTPFTFLILYSALQTVPQDLYEAAAVDGASAWQKLTRITIPLIMPFIFITLFLRGLDSFKTFDMIHVLTGGGPGTLTTSVSIYIYKMAFNTGDIGRAAAASVMLLVALSIPLVFLLRRVLRQEQQ